MGQFPWLVAHHLLLAEVRPLGAEVEDDPREDRVQRRVPEAPPTEHVHAHQVFEVRQLPVEPHLRAVRLPEEAEERRRRLRERVRGELRQLLDRVERLLRREVDEQRLPRLEDDLDGGRLVQRAAQEDRCDLLVLVRLREAVPLECEEVRLQREHSRRLLVDFDDLARRAHRVLLVGLQRVGRLHAADQRLLERAAHRELLLVRHGLRQLLPRRRPRHHALLQEPPVPLVERGGERERLVLHVDVTAR